LRYAEKNDRKLLADTQEMVITLRTLDRIIRTRAQPFTVNPEAISAQAEMIRAYHQVANELASASGDAEAVPPN
jgi:histone H3/H4